jgi:choline dehydrogenase-like flavoprotein
VSGHYDVIIVGSGALAHMLAPSGKRILILERGDFLTRETDSWNSWPVFPSIGSVNHALTTMANAIRVGEHLPTRLTTAR